MPANKTELRRAARLRRKARDLEKHLALRREQKRRARYRKRGGPPRPKNLYDNMGWNARMFETTRSEQGNACALCRKPFTISNPPVRDHKHATPPEPRGLLHNSCNSLIGFAKENPETCRAAAEYLEAWA